MKDVYIIVGDTEKYKGCLVFACNCSTREQAEERLKKVLENPTKEDEYLMRGHTNLRVEKVAGENCWWND